MSGTLDEWHDRMGHLN
jgi:hypothetical protein